MIRRIGTFFSALTFAGCSMLGVRTTPEPPHEVLRTEGPIEVRRYAPQVIAETVVDQDYDDAGTTAFRRIAGYIFGKNRAEQEIAMTAPVLQRETSGASDEAGGPADSQKIAMTAPVLQRQNEQGWWMAFILPPEITLANAPTPDDDRVHLREIEARKVATLRYGGLNSPEKMQKHADELRTWLDKEGIRPTGAPAMASYDPPWTLWLARRNEVQIEVE